MAGGALPRPVGGVAGPPAAAHEGERADHGADPAEDRAHAAAVVADEPAAADPLLGEGAPLLAPDLLAPPVAPPDVFAPLRGWITAFDIGSRSGRIQLDGPDDGRGPFNFSVDDTADVLSSFLLSGHRYWKDFVVFVDFTPADGPWATGGVARRVSPVLAEGIVSRVGARGYGFIRVTSPLSIAGGSTYFAFDDLDPASLGVVPNDRVSLLIRIATNPSVTNRFAALHVIKQ